MRLFVAAGLALAMSLCGCEQEGSAPSASAAAAPAPTATAAMLALPMTPPPVGVNDGFVRDAAVPSLDTARYGKRTFQGVPTLARVGTRLWAAWFGDTRTPSGEQTGNFLVLTYSDNGGRNWSREFYLVPVRPDTDRVGDARLWQAPDGKLWVFYTQSGNGKPLDGPLGVWVAIIPNPLALTPTFEPGFRLTDGFPGRPFLYNGEWLMPTDSWCFCAPNAQRGGQHVWRLDWRNKTLVYLTTVPRNSNADFNEPAFVQRRDGSLLVQSRTLGGIVERTAPPNSFVWSAGRPFTAFTTASARHAIARSPTGRLVMVFNKSTPITQVRTNMTVAFSDDDGATWPHSYTFDTRDHVSYPDIAFESDGTIVVIYDVVRFNGKISLARINEASVIAKKSPKVDVIQVSAIK